LTLTVRNKLLYSCIVLAAFACVSLVGCSSSGGPSIKKASAGDEEDSGAPGAKTAGAGGSMPGMPPGATGGGMPGMTGGGMPGMTGGGMPGMTGSGMPGMPGMTGGASAESAAPAVVAQLPARPTVKFKEMIAGRPLKSSVVNGKTIYLFTFKDFYEQPWKCELPADVATGSQPKEVWTNTFIAYKRSIVDPNKSKSVIVSKRVDGFPFISPPPERTASASGAGTGMPGMPGMGGAMGMGGRMPGMGGAGMPGMPGMLGMGGAGMPGMPGMSGAGAGMRPGASGGLPGMSGMMPPR